MKWYFASNDRSARYDYMIRAAVESALASRKRGRAVELELDTLPRELVRDFSEYVQEEADGENVYLEENEEEGEEEELPTGVGA